MNVIAYEKEADELNHFYFMFFPDMLSVNYRFAGSHIHKSIEMLICTSGKMRTILNNEEKIISKGEILIINSFDWHFYEYIDNASCYILVLNESYINDLFSTNTLEFNNYLSLNDSELENVVHLLISNFEKFDTLTFIGKKAFVLTLFSLLESKDLLRVKKLNINKNICRKIITYIEEHYHEKITIDSVAKHFGYSRNYFSTLFNKLIGESFNSFVNKYRIKKVEEIRKNNSDCLIEDIIYQVGFNSRETYYRCIRQKK